MSTIKENAVVSVILGTMWLVLGWMKAYGINSVFLFPFNFISGALSGLDGGSVIGGIVGKAVTLIIINSFIKSIIVSKGSFADRISKSFKNMKEALIASIPQSDDIKQFFEKKNFRRAYFFMGFGLSFLVYPFITGNGSIQNSGVILLLALAIVNEVNNKKGLISSLIKKVHYKRTKRIIDEERVKSVLSGNALGYAVTLLIAIVQLSRFIIVILGVIFALIGIFQVFIYNNKNLEVVEQ